MICCLVLGYSWGDFAFSEGKKDFCKIDINKKDALEWEIGTEAKEISCFIKFYLTESL